MVSNRYVTIQLDFNLSPELIHEGQARELVNKIQNLRKDSGFEVSDRIHLQIQTSEAFAEIITQHKQYVG